MLCFFGRGVPELQNQNCGIRSPSDVDSTILCGSAAIFRYGKKTVIPDEDLKSKGGLHELAGQDAFGMFRSLAFEPHHTQQTKQNKQNKSKQRNAESAEKYLYLKKQPFPPQEKKQQNLHLVVSFGSVSENHKYHADKEAGQKEASVLHRIGWHHTCTNGEHSETLENP